MKKHLIIASALAISFLCGCGPDYLLKGEHEFPNDQWTYADSMRFEFEVQDTARLYNLIAEVEHSVDYGFQNLYTRIHTLMPSGKRLTKMVSLELSNQPGIWAGDCNSTTCDLRLPLQESLYFNELGHYTIVVEQYMRRDSLSGLKSLSLLIEDSEKQR